MTKLRWGLLCLALVFVTSTYGQQPGRGAPALLSDKDMEDLKLDDKQKEKISKIVKDYGEESKKVMESIRGDGGTRPDPAKLQEAFTGLRKTRTEATDKIKGLLNDDQKKKFDEIQQSRRGGFGGGGGFGGFGRAPFKLGQVLPQGSDARLELNDEQKKKIEEVEKKVKDALDKILTDDQKKKLEQGGGGGGRPGGGRGGRPGGAGGRPGGEGGRPRTDL